MKSIKYFLIMMCVSGALYGQEFYLSEVKIYSGKSALSSGVGAVGTMANHHGDLLTLEVNATLGQAIYMRKSGTFFYGPTFGQQSNAMWAGPIFIFSPNQWLSLTTWDGLYFGQPGCPEWQPKFGFAYQAIDITVGRVGFGYSLLHYLWEKPMNLPYLKYSVPVGSARVELSATYNVRDNAPMFLVAGSYKIK